MYMYSIFYYLIQHTFFVCLCKGPFTQLQNLIVFTEDGIFTGSTVQQNKSSSSAGIKSSCLKYPYSVSTQQHSTPVCEICDLSSYNWRGFVCLSKDLG